MTKKVYVDKLPDQGWGKWNGGAHMLANNLEALHDMAERLGLKREWFQNAASYAHYDLTASKRQLALNKGAIEIAFGEIPDDALVRIEEGKYESRSVRMRKLRSLGELQ